MQKIVRHFQRPIENHGHCIKNQNDGGTLYHDLKVDKAFDLDVCLFAVGHCFWLLAFVRGEWPCPCVLIRNFQIEKKAAQFLS